VVPLFFVFLALHGTVTAARRGQPKSVTDDWNATDHDHERARIAGQAAMRKPLCAER
jgi:hypothetical protein